MLTDKSCKGCGANDWKNGRCDYCGGNVYTEKAKAPVKLSKAQHDFYVNALQSVCIRNPMATMFVIR